MYHLQGERVLREFAGAQRKADLIHPKPMLPNAKNAASRSDHGKRARDGYRQSTSFAFAERDAPNFVAYRASRDRWQASNSALILDLVAKALRAICAISKIMPGQPAIQHRQMPSNEHGWML